MTDARRSLRRRIARLSRGAASVLFSVLTWSFAWPGPAGAAEASRVSFQAHPDSVVHIRGRATLGEWECEMREITAVIEPGPMLEAISARVAGGLLGAAGLMASLPGIKASKPYANITIPISSLQCNKPGMRADVLRALKSDEAPLIVFILGAISRVELDTPGPGDLGRYRVIARGDLVLASVLRPIEVTADVRQLTRTRFQVAARHQLRMTDFGITPPSALFGAIRAQDSVSITFDLRFDAL